MIHVSAGRATCTLLTLLALVAGPAAGQTTQPDPVPPAAAEPDEGGLLAGPLVGEKARAAGETSFGGEPRPGQRAATVPFRVWIATLREMDLDEDQRVEIRAIATEFGRSARRFQRKHGEEARRLRGEVRQAREQARAVPPETLARLREIQAKAPKPEAARQRIWELLDDDQRARLRARLDEARRRMAERRREEGPGPGPRREAGADAGPEADDGAGRAARRLRFLRERRSRDTAGAAPTEDERTFDFAEDGDSH
ncbi:MAG: hypothetical protein ACYTG1_06325 [Planctomycetota bacterium]|jgi:hypothetical protein